MIRKTKFVLLLFISLFTALNVFSINDISVDICIYGGTSAGVIAAYTAQKSGKSVILIEPTNHLGGLSSGGLGFTDIGNKYVIKGLARDFYRRLGSYYGTIENWTFEPSVAEGIFNSYVKEAGVKVLFGNRLNKVTKLSNVIQSIVVENSKMPDIATNQTINAKVFIDCSYEGDLMAQAGVSYTVGRESNSVYKETFNGVQLQNGHQFPDGIDPYIVKGNSASGLLWGISDKPIQPGGTGDKKIQAYNFRICLTNKIANQSEITLPDNYDPSKYELLIRLKEKQPWSSLSDIFMWQYMPNGKTDLNNRGGFSTDMITKNWNYPDANYADRKTIVKQHEDYTKGLLYFLGHDERVPLNIRTEMLKWGYPKDEYVDNNNWSPQLYIRESRRMIGEVVMTQHHCLGEVVATDSIANAAYTMDSHNCDRVVLNGMVKNEGNVEVGGFPPYPISYKAIVPKNLEVSNLLVPVCMSASHIAYGSIRMEPVFMGMSQSAAIAACQAIDNNISVQAVDAAKVLETLNSNPLANEFITVSAAVTAKSNTILAGELAMVNVTFTGISPWNFNYRVNGQLVSLTNISENPLKLSFTIPEGQNLIVEPVSVSDKSLIEGSVSGKAIVSVADKTINPFFDAYVHQANTTTSYTTDQYVLVKTTTDNYSREAFFSFNLNNIKVSDQKIIFSAYFYQLVYPNNNNILENHIVEIDGNTDSYSSLTWNTRPVNMTRISETLISPTDIGSYISWDITNWVKDQINAGKTNATLRLRVINNGSGLLYFYSTEFATNKPHLIINSSIATGINRYSVNKINIIQQGHNLKIDSVLPIGSVSIFSVNGRCLYTNNSIVSNELSVDSSRFPVGMYLVKVYSDNRTTSQIYINQ